MSLAPKTPLGVVPARSTSSRCAANASGGSGVPGTVAARRSTAGSSRPSKYCRGCRGRPVDRSVSKYSSGRPATPVARSVSHRSVLPLRGVAQTRYDRRGGVAAITMRTIPMGFIGFMLYPMAQPPNILYLHSHDTGRYVQPYGHPVPTPNIQRLADQGLLFRRAFAAAPVCSGSRAALLTGQSSHSSGMLGLAHRGHRLADYEQHLVHVLHDHGYTSALVGEQHVSEDPRHIGYDRVVEIDSHRAQAVAPATAATLAELRDHRPFFLSVGFFETHREYFEPTSVRDALYSLPPANLPDTPETRRDMAAFKASARSLDHGVGAVLNALDEHDLADDTLVIFTTDHGLAFPGAKATLTDRGIGVLLILRGPGGFHGGRVSDALVSQIDLFPTICELAGIDRPSWLQGRSLLPLLRR